MCNCVRVACNRREKPDIYSYVQDSSAGTCEDSLYFCSSSNVLYIGAVQSVRNAKETSAAFLLCVASQDLAAREEAAGSPFHALGRDSLRHGQTFVSFLTVITPRPVRPSR